MTLSNIFHDVDVHEVEPDGSFNSILFIDDDDSTLDSLNRIFKDEPYKVLTAKNATEAMQELAHEEVQVIVCDHRMPGMKGSDLLQAIRSKYPHTIRIMLTAYGEVDSIMSAVKSGVVFKFMAKPWIEEELKITIARAFEIYDLQKEVRKLRHHNLQQEEKIQAFSSLFRQERGLLAKILYKENVITMEDYDAAILDQKNTHDLMYRVLINLKIVSEDTIVDTLKNTQGLHLIDLKDLHISADAACYFPPDFCKKNLLLPISQNAMTLSIAMADPTDIVKLDNIEILTGLTLEVFLAKASDLERKIDEVFGLDDTPKTEKIFETEEDIDIIIDEEQDDIKVEEMILASKVPPIVRIVNSILTESFRRSASDIHIEPRLNYCSVRYRIDGLLQEKIRLPSHIHNSVVSRFKILSKLDITEKQRPQDGRITVRTMNRMIDIRVSCLPTLYGENLVLRLLDHGAAVWEVRELGLSSDNLERIGRILSKPQGIIISTGPTGSGKTTLLHSLIKEHLNKNQSYGTIEDPVEYYIEDASQTHVKEKIGLTFPKVLRSMLRQDPDVILIGEMRDSETATISFQAAMTGHLVFSTLHTNNAIGTISRLLNLGVERYLLASILECIIAQRLVRVNCPVCSVDEAPDLRTLKLLDIEPDEILKVKKGRGCARCGHTGYLGRVGVYEIIEVSNRIRDLIIEGAKEMQILAVCKEEGMKTIFEDAIMKIQSGKTTPEEILRVLGPHHKKRKTCKACGELLDMSCNFCSKCGQTLRKLCNQCKCSMYNEWIFCPNCGSKNLE